MAAGDIIWADGMESGAVSTLYGGSYAFDPTYSRIANSGVGLRHASQDDYNTYYIQVFDTTYEEIMFGLAFRTAANQANGWGGANGSQNIITFHDGANALASASYHCGLFVASTGGLAFGRKNLFTVSSTLGLSAPATLLFNTWYWLDGKIRFNNTNGNFEFRINGSIVTSGYNVDTCLTANEYTRGFALGYSDTNHNYYTYYDDLYIMDNAGRTQDYLGDIRVYDIVPSGDAFHTGLTPSTGTSHYSLIDDGLTVNDADYVYSTVSGVMDTYLYTPLSTAGSTVSNVYGAIFGNRARKTDASTKTLRVVHRQGGTTYEHTNSDENLSSTFVNYLHVAPINPATSNRWTLEEINTLEAGIKIEV